MIAFFRRIRALIGKELLTLFRDPKVRIILIAPPMMQLFIFSFAATLEVKNVSVAVLNQDNGKHGLALVHRVAASPTFTRMVFVQSQAELVPLLDEQRIIAALHIAPDFSRGVESGQGASVQLIMDGRRSNAAQIVSGYITSIITAYSMEISKTSGGTPPPALTIERNWFNENLIYLWFTVPSLVAVLAMLITIMVTALSVAREKELGTFEQLLVSPLVPWELLLGKTLPAILVGFCEGLMIVAISVTIFRIPFTGSFLLLAATLLVFVISLVGIGLFLSSISSTQQQAILGAFVFLVPAVTLSGFASPVENMPHWLQVAGLVNPLRHALIPIKGLFLKNMPAIDVWANIWPMLIIAVVGLVLSGWFFTRRLE
ncbi:ABC transporter permease [Desulfovibrio cuneatus]|uniref:ABC transporter permease n=1 Tax=Desulfovibrio cuneatus TaxID=159728 RepID=UPI00040BCE0E|nr:ABC transporter permease [Desulfovibrio cuneatus]